jgi:hypothetical protein
MVKKLALCTLLLCSVLYMQHRMSQYNESVRSACKGTLTTTAGYALVPVGMIAIPLPADKIECHE